MELWEWTCWGNEYGIMGMELLGVMSMELWEWACWGDECEIMEWNYHKMLVTG